MSSAVAVESGVELPRFVQIEPVGRCTLGCRTDGTPDHPPAFMSFSAFCRLIDEFPAVTELHLQGMGEPLMHPRFFDMVAYAAAKGIEVSTNTNLAELSEKRALECVKSGLARMHVSLEGASAAVYEHIRVRAKFDRVLRNIARLTAARRELKSTRPEICLIAAPTRTNLLELPELVRLSRERDIDILSLRGFVEGETPCNPPGIEKIFAAAREVARALNIKLSLPSLSPRPRAAPTGGRGRCDWPWRGAYISHAGDAMPCCGRATPERGNFGNMSEEGVVAIWNNEDYRRFRHRLASAPPPDVCRSCAEP